VFFPRGIEEEEEAGVNIKIKIKIGIHNGDITYQGNASTSRGREGSCGRGRGKDGSRDIYGGVQCYYCHKFGHLEKDCCEKLCDMDHKGVNIVVK